MPEKISSIIPNTTQIPHIIIREWMPRLKDVELRVLLVVTDQTLGWIEDPVTGRRKERDWISQWQLAQRISRRSKKGKQREGMRAVSSAMKNLIDVHQIIQALDEQGNILDTPKKRQMNFGKIYYRLSLHPPQPTLFDKVKARRMQNLHTQEMHTTKETLLQNLAKASELDSNKNKNGGKHVDKPRDPNKPKLPTNALMRSFSQYCKELRKTKPIFVRFKDGNLIKHALKHVTEFQLEMLFIWFCGRRQTCNR
ncbi:MAG: hypothetical protein V1905_00210 [bacterium]